MPKIIENVREQLLCEAKRQVIEHGYASTTIRSVAAACGVGIGTVYNYFKSKEMLVATFVLEGWKKHLSNMRDLPKDNPRELLFGIYSSLQSFAKENEKLFSDSDAIRLVSQGLSERHKILRSQIADFVIPLTRGGVNPEFTAEFVAESLICWSMNGTDFDTLYRAIEKIIK